ncbi:hypothetical protein DV515_00011320 [Chloebia gouldiae]|uniref:Uncharacterized protein n=1 Tax=Chloebia gouldiae TaxID=44316 RepID=A0A3L8S6U5_CHLGU|nr:hypothetical protein DV515_00011320 [Chloebia gouldiae]
MLSSTLARTFLMHPYVLGHLHLHFFAGMKAEIFLGLLVILRLFQASVSSSYDVPLELSDMSLLSSVAEARQLVDAAYKRTREQ